MYSWAARKMERIYHASEKFFSTKREGPPAKRNNFVSIKRNERKAAGIPGSSGRKHLIPFPNQDDLIAKLEKTITPAKYSSVTRGTLLRHPREGGGPERLEKTGFPPPRE
jgi:hypothetical protein